MFYWRIAMSAKAPDPRPARHWAAAVEHPRRGLARLRHGATFAAARDFEAGIYLQDLLVAAIVAILLTRLFLGLTGFHAWAEADFTSPTCSGADCSCSLRSCSCWP